ncbi:MAG: outer membrane protein assembly factor BamE [Azonexus sp.]
MFRSRLLILGAVCSLLAACGSFNAYKIDIQQGNVLSQEMVAQLKPGQTREQVRYILGSPLLADMFHQHRWDYVYSYRNGRTGEVETRQFSVYFNQDNLLERVAGDISGGDPDELAIPKTQTRLVDFGTLPADGSPMPPPEGEGFFRSMMHSIGF